jgi:tetratricopeptide (TPR) repeat protein
VCEADLDTLGSLLDKSLLRQTPGSRFFMLETISEYALAKLEEFDDAGIVRRRHAEWFVALAEEAEPRLRGGVEQALWFDRLELELENFRVALRWADDVGDGGSLLRLSAGLWRFWALHGHRDGLRWVEEAVAQTSCEVSTPRVAALLGAAVLASRMGDHPITYAISLAERAIALARELGDEALTARALVALGVCLEDEDPERALKLYTEGRKLYRSAGDDWGVGVATVNLAQLALRRGDLTDAANLLDESLQIARATGDEEGEAVTLASLGLVDLQRGRIGLASSAFGDSLRIASRLGLATVIPDVLVGVAALATERGNSAAAASLLAAADLLLEPLHASFWPAERSLREGTLAAVRASLDANELEAIFAQARLWTREDMIASAFNQLETDARQA